MTTEFTSTEELLRRVEVGDEEAIERLLQSQRVRLRKMVAVRLDKHLTQRIDASDVVQEVLLKASGRLIEYARTRPLPFYPWLRQLAWERLVDLHRRHVTSRKRSVSREQSFSLPDESAMQLANQLGMSQTSPSNKLIRVEMITRLHQALETLDEDVREVLTMRYLEELSTSEIAAVLGVSPRTVQLRHRRGLEQLHGSLHS
jgi:RNA polymerase sigma-70 factor (ECF subfamily)